MTVHYLKELSRLEETYRVALSTDVRPLATCVERWARRPMLMVGSGGSYSVARYAAYLHESITGQLARAATPLEVLSIQSRDSGLVCFSASGRNQDILAAFRVAATRETEPLSALVLASHSPLEELGTRFRYADIVCMAHTAFADGFLAVASLVGATVLLARAYREVYGQSEWEVPQSVGELIKQATSLSELCEIQGIANGVLKGREHLSVLYSTELTVAAVDLESRFVEAALGSLHVADLRNFGHGRHFWMARKANETGVLALVSEEQAELGRQTVSLLPKEVAVSQIWFRGSSDIQGIAGLVVGIFVAGRAAQLARVDPGRPGVPAFGRRMYHLKVKRDRMSQELVNRSAAIKRKGVSVDDPWWVRRYEQALQTFNSSRYEALVLDYDGTLCDARERGGPLRVEVVDELKRLGEEGAVIGFATGRGPSAGKELRSSLPHELHCRMLVGYYNGAEVRILADDEDPIVEESREGYSLVSALATDPILDGAVRSNTTQVTTGVKPGVRVEDGAEEVRLIMRELGVDGEIVTSAHSIDVCMAGQSKIDILEAMRDTFGLEEGPVLRIGDRGRPPGNDWKLLDDPHGLSVENVSSHPDHCWSLAPAGVKGTQAAVYYLKRLCWTDRGGRLRLSKSSRP